MEKINLLYADSIQEKLWNLNSSCEKKIAIYYVSLYMHLIFLIDAMHKSITIAKRSPK